MVSRRWTRIATCAKQPERYGKEIHCRQVPLNDENSGALTARSITEKSPKGQVSSVPQLRQPVTNHVACSHIGRRFDARRPTRISERHEGHVQKRCVLNLVVDFFGLPVDGHSRRHPEPCKVVMRYVATAADRPTVPLGLVASVFLFNVATRGVIATSRVFIRMGLLLVPTTLLVVQGAVLVAVCPDRWGGGRQRHDDGEKTGTGTRVGHIKCHYTTHPPTDYIFHCDDSQLRWFGQYQ